MVYKPYKQNKKIDRYNQEEYEKKFEEKVKIDNELANINKYDYIFKIYRYYNDENPVIEGNKKLAFIYKSRESLDKKLLDMLDKYNYHYRRCYIYNCIVCNNGYLLIAKINHNPHKYNKYPEPLWVTAPIGTIA